MKFENELERALWLAIVTTASILSKPDPLEADFIVEAFRRRDRLLRESEGESEGEQSDHE